MSGHDAMVTTLSNLPLRSRAKILAVGGSPAFRRRLMELGLVPGTPIEVSRIAPLGDPIQLVVRGCRLSIRRKEAAELTVFSEDPRATGGLGCGGCAA
ncbi:MAG: ferrous iron transport protein A [Deltaproteobacteria bacterium]|nr:ferrous iron transport protein A [Deltaproteobacteria bacterium]